MRKFFEDFARPIPRYEEYCSTKQSPLSIAIAYLIGLFVLIMVFGGMAWVFAADECREQGKHQILRDLLEISEHSRSDEINRLCQELGIRVENDVLEKGARTTLESEEAYEANRTTPQTLSQGSKQASI